MKATATAEAEGKAVASEMRELVGLEEEENQVDEEAGLPSAPGNEAKLEIALVSEEPEREGMDQEQEVRSDVLSTALPLTTLERESHARTFVHALEPTRAPISSKPRCVGSFSVAGFNSSATATATDSEDRRDGNPEEASNVIVNDTNSEARDGAPELLNTTTHPVDMSGVPGPIATAVTRDELEQQVLKQIMNGAPVAEIIKEDKNSNSRQGKARCRVCAIVQLVCAVLIVATVASTTRRGRDDNHSMSDLTPTPSIYNTLTPTSSPTEIPYDHVYVINMVIENVCGHEIHRSNKCGGHLASITTPEEKALVDNLKDIALEEAWAQNATSLGGPIRGVWIGGQQIPQNSGNNTGTDEQDLVWAWSDFSPWFDGNETDSIHTRYGSYWAPGQPNNTVYSFNNKTIGEHHVFLTQSGEYTDENGCNRSFSPMGPGIYILPQDYLDNEKYPDCAIGSFLREYETPVPSRPDPDWVYVINQVYIGNCHVDAAAARCGGYVASITTPREKAIVDLLKDIALEEASKEGRADDGVWIGANQLQGMNNTGREEVNVTWRWDDGSPWFDNEGAYWADGQPNNMNDAYADERGVWSVTGRHYVMLNAEGKYQNELKCSLVPSIFRLPYDYSSRSKYPDCEMGSFTTVVPAPPRR